MRATRIVRIGPPHSIIVASAAIGAVGVAVAVAADPLPRSVVVGTPDVGALGATCPIMIGAAIIVAIEAPRTVMIKVPADIAVRHPDIVMIRPRQSVVVAIGVQVMRRSTHDTAKVVRIGIAIGPHLVKDLTEPHPRLLQRRDPIEAQGYPAVASDLRGSERSRDRLFASRQIVEGARRAGDCPVAPAVIASVLGPRRRDQEQGTARSIDDLAPHGSLLSVRQTHCVAA
ncbi:MAG TPA: hypothetical protein VGI78_29940 [Acetobacteraceae bacterium]